MEFIAPMMVLVVGALVIGSIFRASFVNRRLRENARAFADLQGRLIDKFGDAGEVVRYLESDAGKQLLAGAENGRGAAHSRVLDSLQTGIITLLGGVGLMAGSALSPGKVSEVMDVLGVVALLVGAGFIVSALVSGAMLRRWGLLPDKSKDQDGAGAE
ncbi:MAG TPA: hypothetical protein VGC00_11935 [Thermoanaerobaculia bacterium]